MTKLPKMNKGRDGGEVCAGYYAVDPSGHVLLVRENHVLEAGWRWASQGDLDAAAEAEKKRAAAEKAEAPRDGGPLSGRKK